MRDADESPVVMSRLERATWSVGAVFCILRAADVLVVDEHGGTWGVLLDAWAIAFVVLLVGFGARFFWRLGPRRGGPDYA